MLPQALGQEAPESDQRIVLSGNPALASEAAKFCAAPSSTLAFAGETLTDKSLVTVTCAVPLTDGEATVAALMVTVAGDGKSNGAL